MSGDSPIVVATHDGTFHADDVVAVALYRLLHKGRREIRVLRTRNRAVLEKADVWIDVGGEYNTSLNRFDHHMEGGAGYRENGVPYASAGLVWKHCASDQSEYVRQRLDNAVIQTIDAHDNRYKLERPSVSGARVCTLAHVIQSFCPNWTQRPDFEQAFQSALLFAEGFLIREIGRILADEKLERVFREATCHHASRVLELSCYCPWKDTVRRLWPSIDYVIYPSRSIPGWSLEATYSEGGQYKRLLPMAWAAKEGPAFVAVSGVEGALFCHNRRFCAKATTREAALELARLALEQ